MIDDWYKLKTYKKIDSDSFDIRLDSGGYIFVTFVESIGAVLMETDFGAYGYIWGNIGDETLKDFFCNSDKYYLSDKFSYNLGSRKFKEEASLEESKKKAYDLLLILSEGIMTKKEFDDDAWPVFLDAMAGINDEDYGWEGRFVDDIMLAAEEVGLGENIMYLDYGGSELIQMVETTAFRSLRDVVVVRTQEALREMGYGKKK